MKVCKLGITGGIGSGKSYVSSILEHYGVPVYDTDSAAKRLMLTDPVIRSGVMGLLGTEAYIDGKLNKPLLAHYIFSDPSNADQINSIVHPRVYADFLSWVTHQTGARLVGMESAILFESGFNEYVDYVLTVSAPFEVRLERAMRRDSATRQQITDRMKAQADDSMKISRSHFVIVNDGVADVQKQVEDLVRRLS